MARTTHISAVYGDEITLLLRRLGLEEPIERGVLNCSVCGSVLDVENVGAVKERERQFVLVCSRIACLEEFHGRI